ncbi:hypothetical protein BpHYR1_017573 [Brachionus plicatilis]|uniref:Uncharacterized protein n=1 Tax=Brachionus plicatilis TaxID=10195 RepID=A0A3M7REI5_BRAPC|nr:hypothetical protein BpHYR1_017573 [Brachionus plicatilis]
MNLLTPHRRNIDINKSILLRINDYLNCVFFLFFEPFGRPLLLTNVMDHLHHHQQRNPVIGEVGPSIES